MSVAKITDILMSNLINGNFSVQIGGSAGLVRGGAIGFKATANFARPANTTQYALNDAITDSATAPTILNVDLASFGASVGQFFAITNARVISNVKPSANQLMVNLWVFMTAFAGTNDNSELSVDDATAQTGGVVIPCQNTFQTANNARCISDCGNWMGKLATDDTNLYFTLQDASAYTPQSGETFHIVIEGMLL